MIELLRSPARMQLLGAGDSSRWKEILPARRCAFGSLEYAAITGRYGVQQPQLFVYQDENYKVAYPFFLRSTAALPFSGEYPAAWDARSPEYTGPVLLDPAPRRTGGAAGLRNGEAFDRAFHRFCQDEGIIAEFAHLHPFHGARSFLDPGSLVFDRQIVYVDLTFSLDSLWAGSFSHACRKNIRRAQQENLRVYPAHREDQIVEFHRIYTQTMEKNQAASQYFFPLEYFLAFFYVMAESAIFMLAEHRDQIVAGTLYLHDDWDIYSYLGGADQTFQQVRPTNMVVYETILWGQRHGKRRLILGGGYRPDDGIFRFKSSFSPLRADFYTYRRVHDPAAYGSLCAAWSSHYGIPLEQENGTQGYFPRYRAVPGEVTQTGSTQK